MGAAENIREVQGTTGMSGVQENALTIGQIRRQVFRQVFMGNSRRRHDDEIRAVNHRRQMSTDHEWCRKLLYPVLYDLDSASLGNRHQGILGAGKKANLRTTKDK